MKPGAARGRGSRSGVGDAASLARPLLEWFRRSARDLPWRNGTVAKPPGTNSPRRDPYTVLVSELMLQQTQVSRVLEKFETFMRRFPSVQALASAHEDDVLAAWSGLGYYRRARHLHAAAKRIVQEHGGAFPDEPAEIRRLPGVGRYTGGAIASIAFNLPEPIVDGNVARVLLRIHGKDTAADDPRAIKWLWDHADELARATVTPGEVNEAMMELGATVCTPAAPRCETCPLRDPCVACRDGRQAEIPRPKARSVRTALYCGVALIEHAEGASVLVEQRGHDGLWGGLWQAPTIESAESPVAAAELAAAIGLEAGDLRPDASFEHQTTHRRVLFQVWRGRAPRGFSPRRGLWMTAAKIEHLGLSNPQRRILLESAAGGTLWT